MILQSIFCEWPGCGCNSIEKKEGMGFHGWGHVRGWNIDGELRDFHLCPDHLRKLTMFIKREKERQDGMD